MTIADEPANPPIIESEVVFTGAVWDVRRDRVDYNGSEMVREYVAHTGATAVLAEDEDGRVLVIQQYRHPIRKRDWELPAGLLDQEGESPLVAAQRELAEEVDLIAEQWDPLLQFHTSPGGNNEMLHVFRARGLRATDAAFDRELEEADIVQRWVARDELIEAALNGELTNSILMLSVLAADAADRRTAER
ncbi:NUDIX domain-containing protein [Curtobacterium ammoniigenes]|uniref:NUDIX domain-containing protein n=1 Tax=Curtobacterium ammoniigenes TaxID=395387 RepID=UPI00083268F7|nr:NUDIX hydrolase [Curtobacterium ammoniigenes]